MSSIDKLLIRGIRSFDPQSQNIIEFYTPLTVIVGPNGTGKTVGRRHLNRDEYEYSCIFNSHFSF